MSPGALEQAVRLAARLACARKGVPQEHSN
jgi:hypothetical protein